MPKIFVLTGAAVGQSFDVQSGAVFGRAEDCAVRLSDASISRHHAQLEETAAGWFLVDMGSRNGIFLAGQRLERVPLDETTEFSLGEVVMRFRTTPIATPTPKLAQTPTSSPSQPAFPRAGASPVRRAEPADASDEIVLEGDWDESKAPTPAEVTAFIARPVVRGTGTPTPAAPSATPAAPSVARQQAAAKLAAAGVTSRSTAIGARGVLQHGRIEARSGFFQADFDQHPLWIKATIVLGVLLVCALFTWLAFRAVMMVRGTTAPPPSIEDGTGEGG